MAKSKAKLSRALESFGRLGKPTEPDRRWPNRHAFLVPTWPGGMVNQVVEFSASHDGEHAQSFYTRREDARDDLDNGYFCGSHHKGLGETIRWLTAADRESGPLPAPHGATVRVNGETFLSELLRPVCRVVYSVEPNDHTWRVIRADAAMPAHAVLRAVRGRLLELTQAFVAGDMPAEAFADWLADNGGPKVAAALAARACPPPTDPAVLVRRRGRGR